MQMFTKNAKNSLQNYMKAKLLGERVSTWLPLYYTATPPDWTTRALYNKGKRAAVLFVVKDPVNRFYNQASRRACYLILLLIDHVHYQKRKLK
jgi:hypothetical protein